MGAALDIRGLKRVCASCGIRFYDMNKRPIICPECKTEFTGEIKMRTRRGRAAAEAETPADAADENIEQVEANDDVVSLEDVAAEEAGDDEDDAMTLDDAEIEEDIEEEIDVDVEKE